ncbi:MAG TPA: NAD(P)-binding domain-containing protein [Steroidobacteraceae bacterium]|jgi:8-hydroxy-5-deazaflavin:NADPH oxidoreductase|nr:NAD(P)-binding domain-containing protein [Steroidobacteraceae bacterium]
MTPTAPWSLRGRWSPLALVATVLLASVGFAATDAAAPVRIGIIGTGKIGAPLAELWVHSGHEVMISSRHPETLASLAARLGPKARVGTPAEAAAFGEVIMLAVPYASTPQVGHDYAKQLAGKVVLDAGNPYPERDGAMAEAARAKGAGPSSKEFLPGVRLVRAFNSIIAGNLLTQSNRPGDRIAIPLAGDDAAALKQAAALVRDAGFDPVIVGDLSQARRFDVGSPVYVKLMTAKELRAALNLK